MNHKLLLPVAIAFGLCAALPAHAEIRLSGFGQVVGGMLTDEDDTFPALEYDDRVDFRQESLFAVQVSADLNDKMSATAQVIARGADDFDAEFAWAYATWRINDEFALRVGRQRTPYYKYSDYLEVGYAYPWVRTPLSVYNLGFNNFDGVNLTHSTNFGPWYSQVQLIAGNFDGDGITIDNQVGVAWDMSYNEWLSFRAAYFQSKVTADLGELTPLLAGLRATGNGNVADRLDLVDDTGTFWELGFEVNRANWQVVGEYVRVGIDDGLLAKGPEYYVSGGYRFGKWMPNVTYGRRDREPKSEIADLLPASSPLRGPVVATLDSQAIDANYVGFGVRYDVAKNMAIKADYTRFSGDAPAEEDASLLSAAFVFTF